MVTVGLLALLKPELASVDSIISALDRAISARHRDMKPINIACLKRGFALQLP
jgi:hypothetical protein